jgi:hypothetical protein
LLDSTTHAAHCRLEMTLDTLHGVTTLQQQCIFSHHPLEQRK